MQNILNTHHQQDVTALPPIEKAAARHSKKTVEQYTHESSVEQKLEKLVELRTLELQNQLEERKQVEKQLRQSEEKYRQLIHASNDAIYLLYMQKFELVNDTFKEMLNITMEDLNDPGFDILQLVAPQSKSNLLERFRRIEKGEPVDSRYEFTALTKDGRQLEVEASVSFINYKDGIATQGVIRDVTQRKQLERQVRRSQKIEAITTLAGGIAHDFNNILAIIRGYTELVLEDLDSDSTMGRNLQHVLSASDRAGDLVNQILVFSRQGEERREPVYINEIIREVTRLISPTLPDYIEIRHTINDNFSIVNGDPVQLHQVIVNLCANALHAMRENGGTLEIKLEHVKIGSSGLTGFENAVPGPYVKITVKDSGHGMGKAVTERIFDPYFTTRSTGEGSGMGLAVIYGIIKSYGGEITVESEPNLGTEFHLYLPRLEPQPRPMSNAVQQGGNERILLVDEEKSLIHIQEDVLEQLGYTVMAVSRCIEALDIFNADPEIFDLVILNQTMPDMSGLQLTGELLKIRADIPIILSTGFGNDLTRDAAIKAGVKGFIMKPVIMREIAKVIRDVMKKKQSKNDSGGQQ